MDWVHIGLIAGILLTITTVVLNSFGILVKVSSFIGTALGNLIRLFRHTERTNPDVPIRTVVVIQQPRFNALWWSKGSFRDKPILQVVGDFNITNIWSKNIKLSGAVLRYRRWLIFSHEVRGDASVKDLASQYSGNYPVPPNTMTWLRVQFHFGIKRNLPTKDFVADVAVIDQFNNYHWITKLRFKNVNEPTID